MHTTINILQYLMQPKKKIHKKLNLIVGTSLAESPMSTGTWAAESCCDSEYCTEIPSESTPTASELPISTESNATVGCSESYSPDISIDHNPHPDLQKQQHMHFRIVNSFNSTPKQYSIKCIEK